MRNDWTGLKLIFVNKKKTITIWGENFYAQFYTKRNHNIIKITQKESVTVGLALKDWRHWASQLCPLKELFQPTCTVGPDGGQLIPL